MPQNSPGLGAVHGEEGLDFDHPAVPWIIRLAVVFVFIGQWASPES
jgi:hypothetical protein